MNKHRLLTFLMAVLMVVFITSHGTAAPGTLVFNDSKLGNIAINVFDWLPDNGLAVGAVPLATSPSTSDFDLHFQASLGNFQLNSSVITGTGLHTDYEITIVYGVTATGSLQTGAGGSPPFNSNFFLSPAGRINYFKIYYDTAKNANPLTGTGYNDGILLMSGRIVDISGLFTVFNTTPVPLDQYQSNNYPNVTTVAGTGGSDLRVAVIVDTLNPDYFPQKPDIVSFNFFSNTSQITPFKQVDPAAQFFNGSGFITPTRGTGNINGYPAAQGAADFQFQVDANSSVNVNLCSGTIGDFVWHDLDRNGLQDAGEPGIDGVTVSILNALDNSLIAIKTTGPGPLNQHGYYQFTGLCAGDYKVVVNANTLPTGFTPTTPNAGGDPAVDSNGSPASVNLATDSSSDQTIDFGYISPCTGTIGDYVWMDTNRDGIQNDGPNAGINGVTVKLFAGDGTTPLATTTTGPNGFYQFGGLCAGDYKVVVDETTLPPALVPTVPNVGTDRTIDSNGSPAPVTLPTNSSSDQTIDFGYVARCTGTIGNFVWLDQNFNSLQDGGEPGIDGVTIELRNASDNSLIATTSTGVGPGNQNGYYQFTGVCAGNYRVVVSVPPPGLNPVPLCSDSQSVGNDSNCSPALVTMPNDNSDNQTIDFGFESACTGTIGNFVWEDGNINGLQDSGEPGINGVTVNLRRTSDNSVIATTTTITGPSGDGYYQFNGLCAGSYKVEVITPTGYLPTTPCSSDQTIADDSNCNPAPVDLASNFSSNQTIDFGFYKQPAAIGDYVWNDVNKNGQQDDGDTGIGNVTIKLYTCGGENDVLVATTTTNASGFYSFTNLMPGSYKVEFTAPSGYTFTTQNVGSDATDSDANAFGVTGCYTLAAGETNNTVDAGLSVQPATIGDRVWNDLNKDGIQDGNEPGISGVKVELFTCANVKVAETFTNGNGLYSFSVMPGDYYVKFTLPTGYTFTMKDVGGDTLDSDADPITGQTICTTLTAGENDTTWDAGMYLMPATIGDKVWNDLDKDGVQDGNEPGLPNVKVELYTCAGVKVAETFTNANGIYSFSVEPGDYYVKFYTPTGYAFSPADQGGNDALDSDANTSTGQTICTTLTAGENDTTWDAGMYLMPATIGDKVWNDLDKDGVQDGNEPGLPNVKVELYTCAGVKVAETFTNANGIYSFSVEPGDYYVKFTLPTGYSFTMKDVGGDTLDSDADPTTGQTICTTLSPGENDPSWDAGMFKVAPDLMIKKYTNGDDANSPTGPKVPVGSTVTWTYIVTNTGNVDLTNVIVTDDKVGAICTIQALAVGASQTCTKTGIAVEGQYANTGCAEASFCSQVGCIAITKCDPSHYYGVKASIDVEKYISNDGGKNWYDADDAPGLSVPLCSQPPPTCAPCSGGITKLTLLYKGYKEANVVVKDATGKQLFSGTVYPNKTFTFQGMDSYGTMTSYIKIYVGSSYYTIYTDCSKPLYPGMITGCFTVVSGYSKNGGMLCPKTSSYSDKDDDHYSSDHKCSSSCSGYNSSSSYSDKDDDHYSSDHQCSSSCPSYKYSEYSEDYEHRSDSSSSCSSYSSSSSYSHDSDDDEKSDDHSSCDGYGSDSSCSNQCYPMPTYPNCKVQFKYVVKNTGNETLTNITLTDDVYNLVGKCTIPATLGPGQEFSCMIGPFDAMAGQHTNTATATGMAGTIKVMDSDKANYFGGKPMAGCVRSPGYWKNHPEAWPVQTIIIGGHTYTKNEAIAIMDKPVAGDKTYTMFPALVSAKLNVLSGANATCIADTIAAADSWMFKYPVGSGVKGDSDAWKMGEPLYMKLDQYNNGYLCASYCGDQPPQPPCPKIDIEKYTNGYDADVAPGPYIWVGEQVKWTYVVKNTGNAPLTGIKVTDDKVGMIGCPKSSLMPGESMTCTATGTAVYGQYMNTGCVEGYASGNVKVSDCDKSYYYGQKGQMGCGTGSPGYWKNHPNAWPTQTIVIGGVSYSKTQAIAIMSKSVSGDKTYTLFDALVSAKLNVMSGTNASCISDTITAADMWFKTYKLGSGVSGSSDAWKQGEPLYWKLDNYNNGLLCAPHRDSTTDKCGSYVPSECFISGKDD
ncbi:MAG: hypothetical protein ED859_12155 [Desulfuromonadales bacterium]|nr:MAG: hypothetical protein ED859_12155 [Desulfuromonadales bacterium]